MLKVLLNRFDDPKLSEQIFIGKGDMVFAKHGAEEFGFTVGQEYEVQGVDQFGDLVMKNDKGEQDSYTVEYFQKHKPFI